MQGINEKILSLNYKDYIAEIKTADAQQSFGEGVIVLVTGYLTGKDNVRKKFVQSFFLAPQEKGYFVLNDVFRYVEDNELADSVLVSANGIDENLEEAPLESEQGALCSYELTLLFLGTSIDDFFWFCFQSNPLIFQTILHRFLSHQLRRILIMSQKYVILQKMMMDQLLMKRLLSHRLI